jgi:hypothetical protein
MSKVKMVRVCSKCGDPTYSCYRQDDCRNALYPVPPALLLADFSRWHVGMDGLR